MKNTIKKIIVYLIITLIPFILIPQVENKLVYTIPIVLIIFFSLFKIEYPLLFLPSIIYYRDYHNIIPILCSIIGLTILLRYFIIKNKYYLFIYLIFIETLSLFFYYKSSNLNIDKYFYINILLSIIILLNLIYPTKIYTINKEITYKIVNINYLHSIILVILFLASLKINLLISIYIGIFSILYLSYIKAKEYSFIYSIFLLVYFTYFNKDTNLGILFPILSIIFTTNNPIINILLSFLFIFDLYKLNYYTKEEDLLLITSLITFELIKFIINLFPYYTKEKGIYPIYNNMVENFNDQVLKFSSFLDDFSRNFLIESDEKYKINECFNNIINSFCFKCKKREICFKENKNDTYIFLKNALYYGKEIHFKKNTSELKDIVKNCMFADEIINKCHLLKNKYQLYLKPTIFEKTLERQINGISNTLRQYVIDLSVKKEIDILSITKLRNKLLELGYELVLFNIKKSYIDDFWIEVGISNIDKKELVIIEEISNEILKLNLSLEYKSNQKNTIYFSIIPKLIININYGYNKIAKEGLDITGDNYLIKNIENGNFIAALSDGMGSGFKAYQESKNTLNMIDKITEFEINTSTSINILNTFYSLKETFDIYATLDLITINKSTSEAILYKMGSSNTYHITDNQIKTIFNENLPFGISDLIKYEKIKLKPNDVIIISSDGIIDNIEKEEMEQFLLYTRFNHPQKVAYEVLNYVLNKNNKIKDDMSIIVLKVEKI